MAVTHDSYVKNTTDFIDEVTGIEIPRDALLLSMDVESRNTNIDNNSRIETVKQAFLRVPDFDRPDVDILELLKISLEHNDFLFIFNYTPRFLRHTQPQRTLNIVIGENKPRNARLKDVKPVRYL